jgi:hypothetical protein
LHITPSGQPKFLSKFTCQQHRRSSTGRTQTHLKSFPSPEGEGFAHPRCGDSKAAAD